MKRHLWPIAWSIFLASSPVTAQDLYSPSYENDTENREFHFNPNNVMNRMPNPMQGIFGSSNRRYNSYPSGRYAPPPAYPPGYGYPAYQPPTGYGYGTAPGGYANTLTPPAVSRPKPQPVIAPENKAPYQAQSLPKPEYQAPGTMQGYRFRPMDNQADPSKNNTVDTAAPTQPPAPLSTIPSMVTAPPQEPLAPMTYPPALAAPEPLAPLTYPDTQKDTAPPIKKAPETVTHEGRTMKFRPLDQPGYTPGLDQ
ncbi:MAG: hypothetical protein KZQ80_13385 [Candidatus Thiodiazotropha sp. (ex Monitilora ramsayi)]|nr:hypothetical protein [Candidatus Thiodiazotropha sp. (ex Monitilora ramsayi)]